MRNLAAKYTSIISRRFRNVEPIELLSRLEEFSDEHATRLRKQWEAERLQPTPGPPDLEGVSTGSLYIVKWDWPILVRVVEDGHGEDWRQFLKSMSVCSELTIEPPFQDIEWHIGPFTITAPELPKCPWCGNTLHKMGRASFSKKWITLGCDSCAYETETFKTEAEAIAAARKAGE